MATLTASSALAASSIVARSSASTSPSSSISARSALDLVPNGDSACTSVNSSRRKGDDTSTSACADSAGAAPTSARAPSTLARALSVATRAPSAASADSIAGWPSAAASSPVAKEKQTANGATHSGSSCVVRALSEGGGARAAAAGLLVPADTFPMSSTVASVMVLPSAVTPLEGERSARLAG